MEWTTVIFLGMSMVSLLLLMGIIIFGTRKSSEFKELESVLGKKAQELNTDTQEILKALQKSEAEKEQILKRLQNLETIVTSEAWESIQSGEESETVQLHLEVEEPEELEDKDKAAKIAKRVR